MSRMICLPVRSSGVMSGLRISTTVSGGSLERTALMSSASRCGAPAKSRLKTASFLGSRSGAASMPGIPSVGCGAAGAGLGEG